MFDVINYYPIYMKIIQDMYKYIYKQRSILTPKTNQKRPPYLHNMATTHSKLE